ncbi:hypothetical protein JMJ56_32510 [Belnapia sp. T18]|uniref:Uncharacterized protein n=1 Tax=Belnapia arida TaxID=2804533 RepID=A0ABS1UDE7_9PROT|nr:hypothetical protein [Belnapia arida]MBL6082688.1 hypothetical protein [Belnapia arida]
MPVVTMPSGSMLSVVQAYPLTEAADSPSSFGQLEATHHRPDFSTQQPTLLDALGVNETDRVLVLGCSCIEVLCDAVRHGCRTASEALTPPKRPEPADVVVAPRVTSEGEAIAIAESGRRALMAGGQGGLLALVLAGAQPLSIAQSISGRLRAFGFRRIRIRRQANGHFLLMCNLRPAPVN